MRKLVLACFVACALVAPLYTFRGVKAAQPERSLELGVTTDRTQYRMNDRIRFEVKLMNTGRTSFSLFGILSWGDSFGDLSLAVVDENGRKLPDEIVEHGYINPSMAGDKSLVVQLDPYHFLGTWGTQGVSTFVRKPGRYELVVRYLAPFSRDDFDAEPFWGKEDGELVASTFIDVVE